MEKYSKVPLTDIAGISYRLPSRKRIEFLEAVFKLNPLPNNIRLLSPWTNNKSEEK